MGVRFQDRAFDRQTTYLDRNRPKVEWEKTAGIRLDNSAVADFGLLGSI
jgi:hypothetical protein